VFPIKGPRPTLLPFTKSKRSSIGRKPKLNTYIPGSVGLFATMGSELGHRVACRSLSPWQGDPPGPQRSHGKSPRPKPIRPNQVSDEARAILNNVNTHFYLLTVIDYLPRHIAPWELAKTVTQREVQNLLALSYFSEGI
jgi:hypothetical protein